MRIFLRLNSEQNINKAINYEYVSSSPEQVISICPIPEFVGEVKCDCGEKATVIFNNEIYKCGICVKLLLPKTKLVSSTTISHPITKKTVRELKFEWSVNGERWYNLWARNMETMRWDSFLKDVKEMILSGKQLTIEGDYDQLRRRMTIL